MRKVLYNQWIPAKYDNAEGSKKLVQNTQCWETDFKNEGVFHQWGYAYEEFDNGPGNYTVAIVELPNGEIKEILPSNIKFTHE